MYLVICIMWINKWIINHYHTKQTNKIIAYKYVILLLNLFKLYFIDLILNKFIIVLHYHFLLCIQEFYSIIQNLNYNTTCP